MENPIIKFPNDIELKADDLPFVISQSFSEIEQSETKIKGSIIAAERAKDAAKAAKEKSAGWSFTGSKKKEAIEALQDASCEISKAQESLTDAMKQFFQGQKKMAESIKKLYGLGLINMAANRTVVRELELKLKNASVEELSESARQEILNLIQQLKAQEDLYNRMERHKEAIETLRTEMDSFKEECNKALNRISELDAHVSQALLLSQTEEIERSMARLREKSFCNSNAFIVITLLISLAALIASVVM